MTVAELIAVLQRVEDQSLPVVFCDNEDGPTVISTADVRTFSVHDPVKYKDWNERGRVTPYPISCYSQRLVVHLVSGGELGIS